MSGALVSAAIAPGMGILVLIEIAFSFQGVGIAAGAGTAFLGRMPLDLCRLLIIGFGFFLVLCMKISLPVTF